MLSLGKDPATLLFKLMLYLIFINYIKSRHNTNERVQKGKANPISKSYSEELSSTENTGSGHSAFTGQTAALYFSGGALTCQECHVLIYYQTESQTFKTFQEKVDTLLIYLTIA